jgi:hypothetical protein
MGLILTIISSLFTIVIAAPGAVHMHGHQNQEIRGKVALAGPAANIILALLFFVLTLITNGWLASVFGVGAVINAFFGLFNLIPFAPFRWHESFQLAQRSLHRQRHHCRTTQFHYLYPKLLSLLRYKHGTRNEQL